MTNHNSVDLRRKRSLVVWGLTVLAPLATASAVAVFHNYSHSAADATSVSAIAWPTNAQRSTAPGPARPATTSVAPVGDLIAGLEQRLAQNPNDAKGWVLLAQSHAFLGNTDRVDAAIARAVTLGMDEHELRGRVDSAASSGTRHDSSTSSKSTSASFNVPPLAN